MKTKKKQTVTTIFFVFAALLLILILFLFFLALRQAFRYNRILAEYEASQISAQLTELYLSGEEVILQDFPNAVTGFGVYNETGAVLQFGTAPDRIEDVRPSATGEALYREGNRIIVFRTSGRGRQRQEHTPGPSPWDRTTTMLIYEDYKVKRTISLITLLWVIIFSAFISLATGIALLYRKINRIRSEEEENLQLIRLGQAARVLTHEIKNPLGAIRIQEKILAKKLSHEFQQSVKIIGEETERISRLTDRVRDFLKHPQGVPSKTDLSSSLKDLTDSMNGNINVSILTDQPAWVYIDPDNLRSVLENIIGNALQSGGDGEEVAITLEQTKGGFSVTVADNGPGIDPASADRIFDFFYTTRTTGSGIGLAVAKAFIEAAGGSVHTHNRNGGGAVFTINLPELKEQ